MTAAPEHDVRALAESARWQIVHALDLLAGAKDAGTPITGLIAEEVVGLLSQSIPLLVRACGGGMLEAPKVALAVRALLDGRTDAIHLDVLPGDGARTPPSARFAKAEPHISFSDPSMQAEYARFGG